MPRVTQFAWAINTCFMFLYRIPRQVADEGKGFLEDRRPASNFDPYIITDALVRTIVLKQDFLRNPYAEPRAVKLSVPSKQTNPEANQAG